MSPTKYQSLQNREVSRRQGTTLPQPQDQVQAGLGDTEGRELVGGEDACQGGKWKTNVEGSQEASVPGSTGNP